MFHLSDVLQPQSQERVLCVARRHAMTLLPWLITGGVLIAAPFFFLFEATHSGWLGTSALMVMVVLGIAVAARALWIWDANIFIVTSVRLLEVNQSGIWTRVVAEALLPSVVEVSVEQKHWFGMGTVRVRASGTPSELRAMRVSRAEAVCRVIQEQLPKQATSATTIVTPSVDGVRKRVMELMEKAGTGTLETIEKILREAPPS
ncbi:MAG: PH domain-containing protein [Patescibacteria group bacterium]